MGDRFDKERLNSLDIIEVARKLGIFLCGRETAKGRMAHCFLHKDDTPSLRLWKDVNAWKCYSCEHKGDVISLVMEYQGCDFKEVYQWLAAEFNIYLPGSSLYEVTRQDLFTNNTTSSLRALSLILREELFDSSTREVLPHNMSIEELCLKQGVPFNEFNKWSRSTTSVSIPSGLMVFPRQKQIKIYL